MKEDALYQTVISKLNNNGNFFHRLLSLEEIPDDFEVDIGKFTLEKFDIQSGPLVDIQDLGLPTLHEVLQSAFLSVSFGLLTVGAICSAVFRKNGLYLFFDSHSHGENGLSSSDGASSLISFSNLNDLVTYMYAFYDSMKLDTSLQFDFLPINVRKSEDKQSYRDEMTSHMEAYFNDQRLRQAKKAQSNIRNKSNVLSSISIEESKKKPLGAKRKKFRTEYYKIYKRQSRQNSAFKAKEIIYQRESKQSARKNPVFKTRERESKQSVRRNPVFRAKERESKQSARRNPVFRAKETLYQKESKQSARKDPVFKTKRKRIKAICKKKTLSLKRKKENQSNLQEEILFLEQKKLCIRRNQSNLQERTLSLKRKKESQSNLQEKTLSLK